MQLLRIVIIGPGRAGGALGLASLRAGHSIAGIQPGPSGRIPEALTAPRLEPGSPLPAADLVIVAVPDDHIAGAAIELAPRIVGVGTACHLSGFVPVAALDPLRMAGSAVGSLHPLQTLPDAETGAAALAGAFAGITGAPGTAEMLGRYAAGLGMRPFPLADDSKPAYHAAAAAASNFVATALGVSADLLADAGLPFEIMRPLTDAIVGNVHSLERDRALTGPVARGDVETVRGHLDAARTAGIGDQFRLMALATALRAGTTAGLDGVLGSPASS